jgi:type II secretory pathway pseudopilin PulG
MFSLIVTLVSIALVAALALATLYYGGSSWLRGNAAANAATVTNQGQQIRGAMELYYTDHSEYPASLQDLVTGEYLKTVPVPPAMVALQTGLVAPALAAGEDWALLAAGQPAFMVQDAIPKDVCQELNYLNLGSDAIRAKIDPTRAYQCFGPAEGPFTFISGVPGPNDALASLRQGVIEYNATHEPDLPMVTDADPTNPVTVAETKNKSSTASAPPAEGEEPPVGDPGPLGFYTWPEGPDPNVWPAVSTAMLAWSGDGEIYLTSWNGDFPTYGFVSVSNKGSEPLTINGVSVTAPFYIDSDACSGATLPANTDLAAMVWSDATPAEDWEKFCDISVAFTSPVAGTITGTLTLLTDGGPRTLPLSAKAADYLTGGGYVFYDNNTPIASVAWPENYILGSWAGNEFYVSIRSGLASENVYIESVSALGPFTISWTDCNSKMLTPVTVLEEDYASEVCGVRLQFNPTETGTFSGALIVTGSGNSYGIPVSATAVVGEIPPLPEEH